MTDNDVGQTYVTLRAERDAAKNRLDCARKKARDYRKRSKRARRRHEDKQSGWCWERMMSE